VDEVADVLVVPNWAIRLNRETGEAFVNLQRADGRIEEVVVETGLRNEQFSEVLSGLSAGDTVVLTNDREGFNLFGSEE
jgi:HlyD family secretion protein